MAGFSEIIGHEQIIEHLQNAIRLKKVSHAYILDGEEGSRQDAFGVGLCPDPPV